MNSRDRPMKLQQVTGGAFGCGEWPPLIPNTARAGACQGYGVRSSTVTAPGEPAPAQ